MVIETERLYLREMSENDYEALNKVLADQNIMQHYSYAFDEHRVRKWIERNMERYRISYKSQQAKKRIRKRGGDCSQRLDFSEYAF